MNKADLLKIIQSDSMGLLDVQTKNISCISSEDRLINSFQEINQFIDTHNHEPKTGEEIQEHRLATRLASLKNNQKHKALLQKHDKHHLLGEEIKKITSIQDILENDTLNILGDRQNDLFDLKHVTKSNKKESPDYVSTRKSCKDFQKYEHIFKDCQNDLSQGKRKLFTFTSDKQIQKKCLFVLNGMLLFLVKVHRDLKDKDGKTDGRLTIIFENETQSNMLLRSLSKRLRENGYAISEKKDTDEQKLLENFNIISPEDKNTGYIYILKSLSTDKKIQEISNLYKIGFCTNNVEERIINAKQEPTYLMSQVQIITTFECYNLNPQKMELLLHNFFGKSCLNIDIFDNNKKRHTPREWFIAPLEIIEKAVHLIINGGITNYTYDEKNLSIVLKK